MNNKQLFKWGLGLWAINEILKAINSNSQSLTNNVNPSNSTLRSLAEYNTIHHGSQPPQPSQNRLTYQDIRRIMEESIREAFDIVLKKPTLLEPQIPKPSPDPQTIEAGKWLKIIPHPSVVIIIGRRGSGKSALAYWLLELYRYRALSFVLGMPQQVRKLLPEWLGIINDPNDAPQGSTLLVDEAYLRFSARESQKLSNREISRIVNLSRQKRLTLIFVTQQASYIDKNLASALDVLVIKEPAPLQTKFERHEINEIVRTAAEKFRLVSGDRRVWSLVYSQAANFFDMLPNSLPSFWNDRLSRVYASSGTLSETKPAGKTTKKEKVRRVKQLHSMGIPVSQIMEDVGVRSRTTVYNYLKIPDIKSEQK